MTVRENTPVFPIIVNWGNGDVDSFGSIELLQCDLEMFDSETSPGCEVTDSLGRRVRLRVNHQLVLEELSLIDD